MAGTTAAVLGVPEHGRPWTASLAGAFFFLAAASGVYLWTMKPERAWYDGRAAAESIKTLSWQYAVGGAQFPMSLGTAEADHMFLQRLEEVLAGLLHLELDPPDDPQISSALRAARSGELDIRRDLYRRCRIVDQRVWYSQKARFNRRRSHAWSFIMVGVQTAGGTLALLRALEVLSVDLIGLSAALAASAAAWLQAKDHSTLSEAYAVTAHELALIESRVHEPAGEAEWQSFVGDAESAISREHVLWRARRGHVLATELRRLR